MARVNLEVKNLITFAEAAKMLKVSRPTVYNLVEKAKLHPVMIGNNRYLLRNEVEQLIKDREKGE
uniref:Putative DNA binding, helix-turn-helix domain containing protein n=1 Tax=viral metagenome TaxID=1070528 RepID=A0A6M3XYP0_9ZZZZ